ncbi:hypothetical protein ILYODFUR_031080 [Ilyodon furcidens]|uniref:Uncharacterized protein n=1 Tax=Ilyodon furcidens TaxID=33524 RepID=A0ABV0SQN6_9TELE
MLEHGAPRGHSMPCTEAQQQNTVWVQVREAIPPDCTLPVALSLPTLALKSPRRTMNPQMAPLSGHHPKTPSRLGNLNCCSEPDFSFVIPVPAPSCLKAPEPTPCCLKAPQSAFQCLKAAELCCLRAPEPAPSCLFVPVPAFHLKLLLPSHV